jgi:hypothetical protein
VDDAVGRGVGDVGVVFEVPYGLLDRAPLDLDHVGVYDVEVLLLGQVLLAPHGGLRGRADVLFVLHDDLARHDLSVEVLERRPQRWSRVAGVARARLLRYGSARQGRRDPQ